MKAHERYISKIVFFSVFLLFSAAASGQSTLHWLKDESWYPVYEVKGNIPYCFTGDSLVRGNSDELTMLSARDFAPGFLNVEILENRRQGVSKVEGTLQFTSNTGMFTFSARVTSEVDMDDVYYVMRFKRMGEATFTCRSIGSLKAGKPKRIDILMRLGYEMPEQLHFYSGMEEIRTNLVPHTYSYAFGDFVLASY